VIDTLSIPIRTPWECAVEPWIIFRGYGDLWPPVVQFAMGIDRCMAVFDPILVHPCHFLTVPSHFFLSSFAYFQAKYWCGRKASFGEIYASFIYVMNIFGYLSGFILGCIAYCKSLYLVESRIRYVLMVSALSIVLVSIPNGISLFVADAIAKPSTYLACASSSINIFVYLALNREFRTEFKRIILRRGAIYCNPFSPGSKIKNDSDFVLLALYM
ncbi:unnamed protein product, partial [Haemonchus placei]|uniref:Rhomboid domain-containing protein n=1 Tax=Haemonchus placei TaxID=6290 RepID=A0A0N4WVM7_HAEPC